MFLAIQSLAGFCFSYLCNTRHCMAKLSMRLAAQSNSFLTEYMREQNIKPEEIDVLEEVLSDSDEAVPESEPKRRKNG